MNKNRVFIFLLSVLSFLTIFLTLTLFTKYKASTCEENFKHYKKLSNSVLPLKVMEKALKEDIKSNNENKKAKFVTIVSLLAAKYYGDWEKYDEKDLSEIIEKLNEGQKEEELAHLYNNYSYFKNFYEALFCEFIGRYKISKDIESRGQEEIIFEEKYGLKAYSPIAYGYKISLCSDFDNEINFSKQKGHFGNDIAVKKGVPFVAVESGVVSKTYKDKGIYKLELKSFDGKRTYIYSNCDSKKPFADEIKEGTIVAGGQLLGFVGDDNCCKKGGSQILNCPYLHFGMKIKVKTKDKEEIEVYVDTYNILKFLEHHKSALSKDEDGFYLKHIFKDDVFEKNF